MKLNTVHAKTLEWMLLANRCFALEVFCLLGENMTYKHILFQPLMFCLNWPLGD